MNGIVQIDRRKEEDRRWAVRTPASGRVEIGIEGLAPTVVEAEMIESSATGFRASHDSVALESGADVRYRAASASGRARIMWTHVIQGRRVSGFLRLPDAMDSSVSHRTMR